MYGPDYTFLGVPACDWRDPATYADADVVIVGAPFDGGTSHRPGARFGPQVIRGTDYLPADGSRPHLAMRVDALRDDLTVTDAGDLEVFSGEIQRSCTAIEDAVAFIATSSSARSTATASRCAG
jgi:agmatinase